MKRRQYILLLYILAACRSYAQTADLYVPQGGRLFFGNGQGVGVFGNMHVAGSVGQETGNTIHFFGQWWRNDSTASFPDETPAGATPGKGGLVAFQQPNPLHGNLGLQLVTGNYNSLDLLGPSLPSISLENPSGMVLTDQDLSVRNKLAFVSGHVYLNGHDLAVGSVDAAGRITGYDEQKFVVTGGGQTGGSLTLLHVPAGTDTVVFPIGTDEGAYTPAAVAHNGNTEHYRARVFDGVLENGLSGADISDRSVKKTWMITTAMNGLHAKMLLQHRIADEGGLYHENRQFSYLSRLVNNQWDTGGGVTGPPEQPGWLTSGTPFADAAVSKRSFELPAGGHTYYFTSLVSGTMPPVCEAQFTYFRILKEGRFKAKLSWGVLARPGIVSYHIEKRIGWEGVWKTAAVIPMGNIFDYAWEDTDVFYDRPVFYRIRINCYTGEHLYSDLRTVRQDEIAVVYPNPTSGRFTLSVSDTFRVKAAVIYDAAGKRVRMTRITQQDTEFDISGVATGMYFLAVISIDDVRLTTIKLLKTN